MNRDVDVVFFDLDDTLIYEVSTDYAVIEEVGREFLPNRSFASGSLAHAVHNAARRLWQQSGEIAYCRQIGAGSLESLYGEYTGTDPHLQVLHQFIEETDYRERVWTEALTELGIADRRLAPSMSTAYVISRRDRHVPFPDAQRTLARLGSKYQLALLTNGAPAIQRRKLTASGFADYFELVVVSGDLGVGKPDPSVFTYALDSMHRTPDQAVMIGNSLSADVAGARGVGIRTIWLNRDGEAGSAEFEPDRVVASLDEVLPDS